MDGLRWLLLLFGAIVIAGVYFWTRREQQPKDTGEMPTRRVPTLDGEATEYASSEPPEFLIDGVSDLDAMPADPVIEPGHAEVDDIDGFDASGGMDDGIEEPVEDGVAPARAPQKIVTIRLVAKDNGVFAGDELILSLRGIGMRHGKFGIFHRVDGEDEERTVFSAASLVEPGSFDLTNIAAQEIPGISLFLVLPGPVDGTEAFDMMMAAARTLAQSLNGELLDESGSSLSIQRERYLREEIVQYTHTHKVA